MGDPKSVADLGASRLGHLKTLVHFDMCFLIRRNALFTCGKEVAFKKQSLRIRFLQD